MCFGCSKPTTYLFVERLDFFIFIMHLSRGLFLNVAPASGQWVVIPHQGILRMSCSMVKGIPLSLKLLHPASIDTGTRRSMMLISAYRLGVHLCLHCL